MEPKSRRREILIKAAIIAGCWTLYGLFFASQAYLGQAYLGKGIEWKQPLTIWLTCAYIWATITPAILWLARRFPFEKKSWMRPLIVHLLAASFFSLFALALYSLVRQLIFPPQNSTISPIESYRRLVI